VAETVPAPVTTAPATTVAPTTTAKLPVLTLPPPTIATTTTLPPNQAMSVTLNVVTPSVQAGQTAEVQVLWSDQDLADPLGVRTTSVWGDPGLSFAVAADGRPPCESPGVPGSGTVPLNFRYSAPGTYQVAVQVSACDGVGAYAEDRTLTAQITVSAPQAGVRAVVLAGDSGGRPLDAATVQFDPDGPAPAVTVGPRTPTLAQVTTAGGAPATVVQLPADGAGVVQLSWGDNSCLGAVVPAGVTNGTTVPVAAQACVATAPVAPAAP
jgi:hypothetical protein